MRKKKMAIINTSRKHKIPGMRAQALVEFAIALPVLMLMLVGIMEVGRMIITYAMVNNASRDAVRYASAVGRGDDTYLKYNNCVGIQNIARKSAFIVTLSSISISYKNASGNSAGVCDRITAGEDSDITVDSSYLVTVSVQASYKPVVKLIPISQRTFTATSSRTILGVLDLDN
jgi:Flp pilus assembly protein TadG